MPSVNPYETGSQKVIPAVLLYAFYQNQVLMIHRNLPHAVRPDDIHAGKWNGLGGKLELNESTVQAAVREFQEEANTETDATQWKWMGQLYFPFFKAAKKEDWWITVFVTELTATQVAGIPTHETPTAEGSLHWISREKVMGLNLWDGDREFIPHVLAQNPFQGTFFYQDGKCVRHELSLIRSNQ